MAAKAMELGYEYLGLTDHSKSEHVTKGMDDKRFMKYFSDIDKINDKLDGKVRVLKSGEVDILKDGSLDLSKKTMEEMDYRTCAIHTNLNLNIEDMTKRVLKAFESGCVDVFEHPTERIINQRAPIPLDLDRVFESARDNGVAMEIDSHPDRLDLNDENILRARAYKLKFAIDTDAHRDHQMDLIRYGVGTARRGWLTKEDVINTMNLDSLLKFFKK
jgi:DNA polymerase (family 10)